MISKFERAMRILSKQNVYIKQKKRLSREMKRNEKDVKNDKPQNAA